MTKDCPKCGEEDQEGDFIGDHAVLEFYCENCGYYWTDSEYMADLAADFKEHMMREEV